MNRAQRRQEARFQKKSKKDQEIEIQRNIVVKAYNRMEDLKWDDDQETATPEQMSALSDYSKEKAILNILTGTFCPQSHAIALSLQSSPEIAHYIDNKYVNSL